MDEEKIREIIEVVDANQEIPDSLREELITAMRSGYVAIVPNEAELGTTPETPQIVLREDWRVNAGNAARNIGKDLNIL